MTRKSLVTIFLTKELVINLGRDENDQPIVVTLQAGIQEVEQEIADHWFVKAHMQEIPHDNADLQAQLDKLNAEYKALQEQSTAADKTIADLQAQATKDTATIKTLQTDLATANARIAELEAQLSGQTPDTKKAK